MKRQLILGLVLVLLILIAVGTYFGISAYQTNQAEKEAEEAAEMQLCTFGSDDVESIDIHTPEFDYKVAWDSTYGTWYVTEGEKTNINTYYITALCTYGSGLTASDTIGEVDAATLAKYELADPISITYHILDGSEETIYIGTQSSTGEYFYMMKEDSDEVYLVDANTAGYLYVTESQIRYRYIVEDMSAQYTHLYLESHGNVVCDFQRDEDNLWEMVAPDIPLTVDNSMISALEYNIEILEVDEFGDEGITEDQYAEYGFDDPAYILYAEQENGDTYTFLFTDYDPLNTEYVSCLHVETGEQYYFLSSYITFLQYDTDYYMTSYIYKPTFSELSAMEVSYAGTYNDKTLDFDISFEFGDEDESLYICDGVDFTENSRAVSAFEELFEQVSKLKYSDFQSDMEVPDISGKDPGLSIRYTDLDGVDKTLDFYLMEDNTYWIFIDGKFGYASIRQRQLSNSDKVLDAYVAFADALENVS